MTLGELISVLEKADQDMVVALGFSNPHSYRGYYDELAFVPTPDISVRQMLEAARFALDRRFTGWKGGEWMMYDCTPCWLSERGQGGGETLGPTLLNYILAPRFKEEDAEALREIAGDVEMCMDREAKRDERNEILERSVKRLRLMLEAK